MTKPKFFGRVRKGKVELDDPVKFSNYIRGKLEDKDVELTIAPKYKRRTTGAPGEETNFNAYYWAVIVRMVSDEIGEIDDDNTHDLLQIMFNKKGVQVVDPDTQQVVNVVIPAGTKHLSGGEFAEYCMRIRTWANIPGDQGGLGLYIPEPHELAYDIG